MNEPRPARRSLVSRLLGDPARPRAAEPSPDHAAGDDLVPNRPWVDRDESPHQRTWMSWPSSKAVWGRRLRGVQQDIALVARTVARFEPVLMCAADESAAAAARAACGPAVEVIASIPVDDLWMRDTGPVFRRTAAGGLDAVGLNFNGWGRKQTHDRDRLVAGAVAAHERLAFGTAAFVGEGGAIETDGDGTVLATESSLVGDSAADATARRIVGEQFPDRDIVALGIDHIAAGGGGIHCSTHDQPGTPAA